MPKRQNPFGDSSPLQFKTRIGKKEVDMGVCSGENMQSVYDKTKAMMFEGAKRVPPPAAQLYSAGSGIDLPAPLPGQMRLDAGAKLCPHQPMDAQSAGSAFGVKTVEAFFNNNDYPVAQIKNGQLQINALGQLTAGIKAKPCSFQGVGAFASQCYACNRFSGALQGCAFCEKKTCSGCLRTCDQCQNTFCHLCSVINYDDCTERAFCLQCAP